MKLQLIDNTKMVQECFMMMKLTAGMRLIKVGMQEGFILQPGQQAPRQICITLTRKAKTAGSGQVPYFLMARMRGLN
ncbi:MAG TPA: hypothetical protein EYQ21_02625 [Flavobacteriales bacterium]|nr:hypothetical protein [Flavobacteriales bacterium]